MPESVNQGRVCVPVCVRRASELAEATARAAEFADIVELRLDCLEGNQLEASLPELVSLRSAYTQPFIYTLRTAGQGGACTFGDEERADFWTNRFRSVGGLLRDGVDFVDFELELLESSSAKGLLEAFARSKVICSHHDFAGVPADLERIYERMSKTPAAVLKIAARAFDVTDCLKLFRLLERARREGRELIAVAMGEAGVATRILGPSRGGFLTYGALDAASATAPGQIDARDLRSLFRVQSIGERTQLLGLLGRPVSHSLSPHVHNAAFKALDVDAVYMPFDVGDSGEFMRRMVHPRTRELEWNLRGLSVTAPHKSAVIEYLDRVEPTAREMGAVNTVVIEGDELLGYNTDAAASIRPLSGVIELRQARVALVGSGGASRALLWGLRSCGARTTLFARDVARAQQAAEKFGAEVRPLGDESFESFDLVVNATPLGTRGACEHETPATAAQLRGARVVYDLVYNPTGTRLLREAREAGCVTIGGLSMFIAQAAAQFELWTGKKAPLEVMRAAAEKRLRELETDVEDRR
jgi:3-dehydroquinate dehydratase/shikimate dehydrogenase